MTALAVCPACNGTTWRVFRRASRLYVCGYVDVAVKCHCYKFPPVAAALTTLDHKMAAAADNA